MSNASKTFCALLDAHDDAVHRFNAVPDDGRVTPEYEQASQAMCETSDLADRAVPTSWPEFARLLGHMACGGQTGIDEDNANRLMLHARQLLAAPEEYRIAWDAALAEYQRLRAISDAIPLGTPGEDEAVDRYADVMDRLIITTPAPDFDAVLLKMDLAKERSEGFAFSEEYADAIRADVERLKHGVR
ncbi:hypothetical protein [Sphingomonas sp. GM_Shp_1]|uniref:hypothetical protein n=1 Tax=Sphingomonas sp. GM_Shp_1 TaxID=2937381 RepID=UPI00226B57C0|nr:hypothetical protein [Sphingomonas sp. GM_Shp_1]